MPVTSAAVIGAGPAGLGAAFALSRAQIPVTVYEAGPQVGGLARSFPLWGQSVEIGPHLLQRVDPRIDALWDLLVGDAYDAFQRRTRILIHGRLYTYPYDLLDVVRGLGLQGTALCAASAARQRLTPAPSGDDIESWAVRSFGRRAFDVLFRGYVEKLFGVPAHLIDASFAGSLVSGSQPHSLLAAARDLAWRIAGGGGDERDRIVRPMGGSGVVLARLADYVADHGGRVLCGAAVRRIVGDGSLVGGIELADGSVHEHRLVVSTMPLPLLLAKLPRVAAELTEHGGQLRTRAALLVYLRVPHQSWPDQWISMIDPNFRACRVTNFTNFGAKADPRLHTILAVEFWCNATDAIWQMDDESLVKLCRVELQEAHLLPAAAQITAVHAVRVPRAFPVLHIGYRRSVKLIHDELAGIKNLWTIGRFGGFSNDNVHSSILEGMELVEARLDEMSVRAHDLRADLAPDGLAAAVREMVAAGSREASRVGEVWPGVHRHSSVTTRPRPRARGPTRCGGRHLVGQVGHAVNETTALRALVIVGVGGHGRETLDIAEAVNRVRPSFDFLGFLDDDPLVADVLASWGCCLLGPVDVPIDAEIAYVIAIGSSADRRRIDTTPGIAGRTAATLVHPSVTFGAMSTSGRARSWRPARGSPPTSGWAGTFTGTSPRPLLTTVASAITSR